MKRGFTMVEVLVALAIISVGMIAILMAFSAALAMSRNVEEEETAVCIANAVMEQLKGTAYQNLQPYTQDASAIFSGLTGYTVSVALTKPANPAQVEVTVSWPAKGGTAAVALATLAANY